MYMDTGSIALLAYCGWKERKHIATNSTLRHECSRGRAAGCVTGMEAGMAAGIYGDPGGVGGAAMNGDCGACGGEESLISLVNLTFD